MTTGLAASAAETASPASTWVAWEEEEVLALVLASEAVEDLALVVAHEALALVVAWEAVGLEDLV